MAEYKYDEGGLMALYFVLTFLIIILVPLTYSFIPPASPYEKLEGCRCPPCLEKVERLKQERRRAIISSRLGVKAVVTLLLWIAFFAVGFKVATTHVENSIYDPYQILGIKLGLEEKEIKRHYKKLSLKFHPDKVKLAVNQTMEQVAAHFVELTKAYKSLTDETVRQNLENYGHPDGKQEFKVGIAIPPWIVASQNNLYILGVYGIVFGLILPAYVGRWWFGSRQYTKDGVKAKTAESFFKALKEESEIDEFVSCLGAGWQNEGGQELKKVDQTTVAELEGQIKEKLGAERWTSVSKNSSPIVKRALVLLYAYFLRITVSDAALHEEQSTLLLQTPASLTSLLSITLAHNWLIPTLHVMHLHAYLAQALLPGEELLLQLPGVQKEEANTIEKEGGGMKELIQDLEDKGAEKDRLHAVQKAAERWGRLEIFDAQFRVIGERIVTPGSIVQLVFKARLVPPFTSYSSQNGANGSTTNGETDVDRIKRQIKANEERDVAFLHSKKEADDLNADELGSGLAHAPCWPDSRKPGWWVMIGEPKGNRVIVPPTKFSDVPYADSGKDRDYRIFKMQFQAPPQVANYHFQLHFVSDTFVGEDVRQDIILKVEDLSALTAEEQGVEDEISDPEEDTIAGQMAAMRGGPIKRAFESDDDESTTDGDQDSEDSDSDSDSDSD